MAKPDPLFDLGAKRLLIVGAAGEIGAGMARALAARGARLALGDLAGDDLGAIAEEVDAALAAGIDVTDEGAVERFVLDAAAALGGVDGLVNAAGILPIAKAEVLAPESFRTCIDVNLTGAFLLAVAARRAMLETGGGGAQVHLASVSSFVANPGYAAYASSKAGLSHLVRVLAREWARDGITVNALAPSMLEQGMAAGFLTEPRFRERVVAEIPLRRLATVEDLIGPLVMLLGQGGQYVTGQTIPVDGGRTLV
ncbi:MAG: SDR family oxidoreductase [Pseudomonadota bacterium]